MPPTKADYAKINIACKELGLDKHQLLSDRYQIESSKQLKDWQIADLYKHFKGLGWQVKRSQASKLSPKYQDGQHRKIVAMWIKMAKAGEIQNASDRALQAYVKRVTGIDNLQWCGVAECNSLIESLKSWGYRVSVDFD